MKKKYSIYPENPIESIVKILEDVKANGKYVNRIKLQPDKISGLPPYIEVKSSGIFQRLKLGMK